MTRTISFVLPRPTKLLNETLRMHYQARRHYRQGLAWEIKVLTAGRIPAVPHARARITIERRSVAPLPDQDGAVGGIKALLDVLQPHSKRHPSGLGFIADDGPNALELSVRIVRVAHKADACTVVTIEPLEALA